jgi:hypothetical protein
MDRLLTFTREDDVAREPEWGEPVPIPGFTRLAFGTLEADDYCLLSGWDYGVKSWSFFNPAQKAASSFAVFSRSSSDNNSLGVCM